jgi:hypothetical protein
MVKPKQKQQRKVAAGPADDPKKAAEIAEIEQNWPAYTVERKPIAWLKHRGTSIANWCWPLLT